MYQKFDYNGIPDGIIQANGVEGYSSRPVSGALPRELRSEFKLPFTFGTVANGTIWNSTTATGATSKLARELKNVSELYLFQISYSGLNTAADDTYCRFRLRIGDKELFEDNTINNSSSQVNNGWVLQLDATADVVTFNPPILIKLFKNADATWPQGSTVDLAIVDDAGIGRGYTVCNITLLAVTKYFQ